MIVNLVSTLVFKDDSILLVKNKWDNGIEGWTLPSGHLQIAETIEAAARRELFEETGLTTPTELKLELVLQVIKPNETIINFLFCVNETHGVLTVSHDPDGIAQDLGFFEMDRALTMLLYYDVRFAVNSILKKELHEPILHFITPR